MSPRIAIDRDLAELPLPLNQALAVMDLRRERKSLEKKIQAMAESFKRRREPHDKRIDAIDVEIAGILPSPGTATEPKSE